MNYVRFEVNVVLNI